MKTVGDLKEFLKNVPDEILLGGRGHFGEKLDFYNAYVHELSKQKNTNEKIKVLVFSIEDAGEEPD